MGAFNTGNQVTCQMTRDAFLAHLKDKAAYFSATAEKFTKQAAAVREALASIEKEYEGNTAQLKSDHMYVSNSNKHSQLTASADSFKMKANAFTWIMNHLGPTVDGWITLSLSDLKTFELVESYLE